MIFTINLYIVQEGDVGSGKSPPEEIHRFGAKFPCVNPDSDTSLLRPHDQYFPFSGTVSFVVS